MTTNKEKNFVSAVLYVRNNGEELKGFLPALGAVLTGNFERFEVICVNDASTDNSREEIEAFSKNVGGMQVSVVNMSSFHGRELAMEAGVDLAIGDFVYEFDSLADDYDMGLVLEVYQKALQGFDIVSAAPQVPAGKASGMFYRVFNKYSVSGNEIRQESFRILSRRAINRVKSLNSALVYRKAVYACCGLDTEAIFYQNKKRGRRATREEKSSRGETAVESLILFTNVIQRIALYVSLLFLLVTVAVGIYTAVLYCSPNKPVEGWTPLMLFLSMGFSGVFLILAVVLTYLSVVLKMVFRKKQYLVSSIEKFTNR